MHTSAKTLSLSLIACVLISSCASAPPATQSAPRAELNVFAASSLTDVFGDIAKVFEAANPEVKVVHNFAASNQLATQINQGAPADVFASANTAQMNVVVAAGNIGHDAARQFARNRLTVITPKENRAKIRSLQDLGRPGAKIVLADKAVPVGTYSLDFMRKASASPDFSPTFSQTVLANVVSYEENVRAVVGKVVLGEADAGIVYTTDIAGENAAKLAAIEIPDALNTIATYPIAPIRASKQAALAQKYVDFVLSPEGQAIVRRHGFVANP